MNKYTNMTEAEKRRLADIEDGLDPNTGLPQPSGLQAGLKSEDYLLSIATSTKSIAFWVKFWSILGVIIVIVSLFR